MDRRQAGGEAIASNEVERFHLGAKGERESVAESSYPDDVDRSQYRHGVAVIWEIPVGVSNE